MFYYIDLVENCIISFFVKIKCFIYNTTKEVTMVYFEHDDGFINLKTYLGTGTNNHS